MSELHAGRALRAYAAMRRQFARRDGLYRRDGRLRLPRTAAHLWPATRAFAGAVDLLGVRPALLGSYDARAAVAWHLAMLERYWDAESELPAYSSDVIGSRFGGDRYYDDNAWVGLVLVQLERIAPGGHLDRADRLFAFALGGWDTRPAAPHPGGVFWVEQGGGAGALNHDRNTVSNAPNAELGLHLDELSNGGANRERHAAAHDMYTWVNTTLDAGADAGAPGTGLFWDKLRGDGTIDRTLWTYNQGNMVGANVLLARRSVGGERADYLGRAEAIAAKALDRYDGALHRQPAAFNAILFRNLLLLHEATADGALRARIRSAMESYAELAWSTRRDRHDRFRFAGRATTLLDQSAMVQIYALLAWDPADYRRLA
jgi:glycosyl hydrolase family 76